MTDRQAKKKATPHKSESPKAKEYTITTAGRRSRYREQQVAGKDAMRIKRSDAHVVDGTLVPHTKEARGKMAQLQSPPIRLKGNAFTARPRTREAYPAREAGKGMQGAPRTNINLGTSSEHQRAKDEVMHQSERRIRRNH